jgi:hypothetical protein
MIVIIKNRKDEKYKKVLKVGGNEEIKRETFYSDFYDYTTGKLKETPTSKKYLGDVRIDDLYIDGVEGGGIMAEIKIENNKISCPFCDKTNDFEKQEFCEHFLTLSAGPKSIFRQGAGTKSISVWEGISLVYLPQPEKTFVLGEIEEQTGKGIGLLYSTETRVAEKSLLVCDFRRKKEWEFDVKKQNEERSIARIRVRYNEEKKRYIVEIYPVMITGDIYVPTLFAIKTWTIDKDLKNYVIEEESNPIWKFKVMGRTSGGNEKLIYATITDFYHHFVLKTTNQTRTTYYVFSNDLYTLTDDEYKNQLYKKEEKLKEVKGILQQLMPHLTDKEKEELLKMMGK